MCCGSIRASTMSRSSCGTISIMVSPGLTTPPTVWIASCCTKPARGERTSTWRSWSSAATWRSASSESLALTSRNSARVSARRSASIWVICISISLILFLDWAIAAVSSPPSPCSLSASRSSAFSARQRHQLLLPEFAHADQLLLDQLDLRVARGALGGLALDLLAGSAPSVPSAACASAGAGRAGPRAGSVPP